MQTRQVTIEDLQEKQFSDASLAHLAGRCLLDGLEFLRIDPKWPARFGQLLNAHAIRLCWSCLKSLRSNELQVRMRPLVESTYDDLRNKRHNVVPFYGDDFWDWAYILEAMITVFKDFATPKRETALRNDVKAFYDEVRNHLADDGLTLERTGEWFGPAIPTAAYRLLTLARKYIKDQTEIQQCLNQLKRQALTPIKNGKYLGHEVQPEYHQWHLGQVVAAFPKNSKNQLKEMRKLEKIKKLREASDKTYAIARVLQGVIAIQRKGKHKGVKIVKEKDTFQQAMTILNDCQNLSRPLGTGLIGDEVKGSLNVLEAIWPSLNSEDYKEVKVMLNALRDAQKRSNRTGILVALDRERDACVKLFKSDGAQIINDEEIVSVNHKNYEVVILSGKALLEAFGATLELIKDRRVTRTIMVGIAGSLGSKQRGKFVGPEKGHVIIATGTASYGIREKVRDVVTKSPVPYKGYEWDILPTDITLFAHAHRASSVLKPRLTVHEGLIITGNGIKDNLKEKKEILRKWPGGLAVAEEGFPAALMCSGHDIPYLEIRGISDLAQGDKGKQKSTPKQEKHDQELAATNAAKIVRALIKSLGKSW